MHLKVFLSKFLVIPLFVLFTGLFFYFPILAQSESSNQQRFSLLEARRFLKTL